MNSDIDQAKAALGQARADHAAALLAVRDQPGDADTQRRFRDAVQQGRGAWKGYQEAATAGLAAQISGIVPGEFQEEL